MSKATAAIYCTTSLPLSPAMEASSIFQVYQLQILYRRRCPHHNLQCMIACSARCGPNVQSSLANISKKTVVG